ncbi:antitoxin component of MazEF toxin-antitoxin module [Oikeobacillus pervagus]|uniref:Antitoxin component of MazEF toxin-antitoxin module n=1 Tax=Oikeobacillus pervagus TaxID=1325931 RepID=A0AAJ1T0K4_9BACI|nr:AbrB/MazE/SpoVT family DNA-binding domain-containing protein [Oikeobacillus pervagus]MDQ0214526.1 antitoxin component of MazEF toxin-antitoxin module [Oikeobacillus pervagus]
MTTDTLERRIGMDEETTRAVTSKVQKWRNSLAIRIPKEMANHKAFNQGTVVEIIEIDDGLKIVLNKKQNIHSINY